MTRFLRFVLMLSLLFITAILLTRVLHSTAPPSNLTRIMSLPDGTVCTRPCLFGILAGTTTVAQGVQMLHDHPLTASGVWQSRHILRLNELNAFVVYSETADEHVASIVLVDDMTDSGIAVPGSLADSYSLSDLLLAFGRPQVGLPDSDYFELDYPTQGVTAAMARPLDFNIKLRPDMPFSMLMVYDYGPCPAIIYDFRLYHWHGFSRINRYTKDVDLIPVAATDSGVRMPPFMGCQK